MLIERGGVLAFENEESLELSNAGSLLNAMGKETMQIFLYLPEKNTDILTLNLTQ